MKQKKLFQKKQQREQYYLSCYHELQSDVIYLNYCDYSEFVVLHSIYETVY